MESSKSGPTIRSKFRLLYCCNAIQDDVVGPRRKKTDPLLDYIAVAEKQRMVLPAILSSALAVVKGGGGEGGQSQRKRLEHNKSLGRALMAVFNHKSWAKKINSKRKTSKKSFSKLTSTSSNTEGESEKITRDESNSNSSSSNGSFAFTPSSLSSSTNSSNGSTGTQSSGSLPLNDGVTRQNQNVGDNRKGYFGPNMALCFLLITSLLVLILYGKFCAILCTSTGFFTVPPPRRKPFNDGINMNKVSVIRFTLLRGKA